MTGTVQCGSCKTFIADETPQTVDRKPCPICGSALRDITMEVTEEIHLYEKFSMKQKQEGIKKPVLEHLEGDDYTETTDTYSKKIRVIDRKNDRYYERVSHRETGEVIHECEEKLSEHFGRGSAKKQPHNFSHEEVEMIARAIWEKEGRPDGKDKKHWEMAIEDLRRVAGGAAPKYS